MSTSVSRLLRWRRGLRSDAGVTLMELMVGLTIMTIFMGMFTGAAVMMYSSTSKAETIGETASQLSIAFSRLDTSVRYASTIGPVSGTDATADWSVAWESKYTGTTTDCTQLILDTSANQLKQQTWSLPFDSACGAPPADISSIPLASNVYVSKNIAADPPFDILSPPCQPHQQLRIYLVAEVQSRSGPTTSISDVTFTAFNSSVPIDPVTCPPKESGP